MSSRRCRFILITVVIVAVLAIAALSRSHRGTPTHAATRVGVSPSVTAPLPSIPTISPRYFPSTATEPAGFAQVPVTHPTPVGPPDAVVHFTGTPVDSHIVLPTLPPPPHAPAPPIPHDEPVQARPTGGYHTPTAGQ